MEDFFEQFKRNLENRPEPSFEERNWKAMHRLLDQMAGKSSIFRWWWLALPLLLLLLGSDLYLLLQLDTAKRKLSSLEIQRDTLVQTRVIYQTDTIYRFGTSMESVSNYQQIDAARTGFMPAFDPSSFRSFYSNSEQDRDILNPSNYKPPLVFIGLPVSETTEKAGGVSLTREPFVNFDLLTSREMGQVVAPVSHLPLKYVEPASPRYRKTIGYHLQKVGEGVGSLAEYAYDLRPRAIQLGLAGGWAYPFNEGLVEQGGFSTGLNVGLEFSQTLQMWIEASYIKVHFISNKMDETLGIPVVQAPSDDFVFAKAEVPQPSYQFSAGMQYSFYAGSRWKPSIGAGYGAIKLLPYEIAYDFENRTHNIEWKFEQDINKNDVIGNFLLLRAGFEYEITDQWNAQFLTSYRTNWRNKGLLAPKMLGVQGGLKFRL